MAGQDEWFEGGVVPLHVFDELAYSVSTDALLVKYTAKR